MRYSDIFIKDKTKYQRIILRNKQEEEMKKRLIAALLSVTLLVSNIGINTYAMEETGGSIVTQEETEGTELLVEDSKEADPSEKIGEEENLPEEETSKQEELLKEKSQKEGESSDLPLGEDSLEGEEEEKDNSLGSEQEEDNLEDDSKSQEDKMEEEGTVSENTVDTDSNPEKLDELPGMEMMADNVIDDFTELQNALKNGGTYTINGSISTDQPGSDVPLIVKQDVVFNGGSITSSYAGLILQADATFNNTTLQFKSNAYLGIFANGHELSLSNATIGWDHADPFSISASGVKNNTSFNALAGSNGKVTLSNVTFSSGSGQGVNIYSGNIYNTTSGVANNDTGVTYPVDISISGINGAKLNIYGHGGTFTGETAADAYNDKIVPSVLNKVTGAVNFNIVDASNSFISTIDGATGVNNVGAILNLSSAKGYTTTFQAENLGGIKLAAGDKKTDIKLTEDFINVFYDSAVISLPEGTKLDLTNLWDVTVKDFSGGGELVLGEEQLLTITGNITGSTDVGIGEIFASKGKDPKEGHTYIISENSTVEGSFNLLPSTSDPDLAFVYENGSWRAPGTPEVSEEETKIASVSIKEGYETITVSPDTQVVYEGLEVVLTNEYDYIELSWLPVQFMYKGSMIQSIGPDEDLYYHSLVTINNKSYKLEFIGTTLYISENGTMTGLPEGTYEFYIIIPADFMQNDQQKSVKFTVVSGEEKEEIINAEAPNITAVSEAQNYTLKQNGAQISVTAASTDQGQLSYQWYKNNTNSTTGGEKIQGAETASYNPPTEKAGTVYYYCEVTNTNNNVNGQQTATLTSGTIQVTVEKGEGQAAVSLDGWTYGDTEKTPSVTSITNEISTVTYKYSGTTKGHKQYGPSSHAPTEAGSYTVVATLAENNDYTAATAEKAFTIAPKTVSIASAVIEDKAFDGEKTAVIKEIILQDSTGKAVELKPGDDFTAAAEFADNQIGNNKTVTVTVNLLNPNYTMTNTSYQTTGNILENWGDISNEDRTEQGFTDLSDVPEELWIAGMEKEIPYRGKAVTQDKLNVYHHLTKLEINKDYTVKYKNNVNAGSATITITGKGNYEGSIVKTFEIVPLDISEALVADEMVTLAYNGKVQKATTTVSYVLDGKIVQLKKGTDYEFIYPGTGPVEEGEYEVVIQGKGNYEDENSKEKKKFTQVITKKTLLSKLTLTKIPDQKYTDIIDFEEGIKPEIVLKNGKEPVVNDQKPQYTVEYKDNKAVGTATVIISATESSDFAGSRTATFKITGTALSKAKMSGFAATMPWTGAAVEQQITFVETRTNGKEKVDYTLKENTDYKVSYEKNTDVGTATVVYEGIGGYTGTVKKTFKITGTAINKAVVDGITPTVTYAGSPVELYDYTVTLGDKELKENTDYIVSYKNNNKAGSASIIFTGINGYTGTVTKSFKITAYNLNDSKIHVDEIADQKYLKGGVSPEPVITYGEGENAIVLQKGVDYTLSYANNKAVGSKDLEKKAPGVTITGKGGFTGKLTRTFTIEASDLSKATATVTDIVYLAKANICKPKITLIDADGKTLAAGTDYDKNITYTYVENTTVGRANGKEITEQEAAAGSSVNALDIIPEGTKIKATVIGIKNYADSKKEIEFRYIKGDMAKATITIPAQTYTGKAITLKESDLTVTINKVALGEEDFEIASYAGNVAKGTAKVTIRGTGNYGGTKTATFKINSKNMNFTLVFDANTEETTGVMKAAVVSSGGKLPANTFKKAGYTFTGWNTEKDGNGTQYADKGVFEIQDAKTTYGRTITLYAQWKPTEYTITYQLNDKNVEDWDSDSFPKTYTVEDTITFDAPYVREGWSFLGWYTDSRFSANKLVTGIEEGSTGNKVFYAKWEVIPYSIQYHLNDEEAPKLDAKKFPTTYNVEKELTLGKPYDRKGYIFAGWYADEELQEEVTKIAKGETGDREFYAKWDIIEYSITYHLNDEDAPELDEELFPRTYTIEDQITLKQPEKEGWSFQGWYTDSKFSTTSKVTEIAKGTMGDKVFYAKWKIPFVKPVEVPESYIDVSTYGVYPDDGIDDTEGIQKALTQASTNYNTGKTNTVYLPAGEYNITPVTTYNPRYDLKGIVVESNTNLVMDNNAILQVAGTNLDEYVVIDIQRKNNVKVQGGQIQGERYRHIGKGGEGGKGICIIASSNVTVSSVSIASNWGDGIYLGEMKIRQPDGSQKLTGCDTVTIENCEIFDNRRNNIAIVAADNVTIDHCLIYDANGTDPQCGILNEPNPDDEGKYRVNRNVTIKDTTITTYKGINDWNNWTFMSLYKPAVSGFTTGENFQFINCTLQGAYGNYSVNNLTWTNVKHTGNYMNLR